MYGFMLEFWMEKVVGRVRVILLTIREEECVILFVGACCSNTIKGFREKEIL